VRLFHTAVLIIAGSAVAAAQTPTIADGGVLNGASFAKGQPVAAGSLVSIFGSNLASTTAKADSIPLSTSLSNISVTFNGIAAPMIFASHDPANGDQLNVQVPWEVKDGSAQVVVKNGNASSAPATVTIATAPGIFNFIVGNTLQAVAYGNTDYLFAAPAGAIPGLTTHPAKINDPATLVLLATGLGQVSPSEVTGSGVTDINALPQTVTKPQVLVGGVPAQVVYSGMTPQFPGVYQINIIIQPGTPTGNAVPVQISMNGVTSTNQVTIAVSN